MEVVLAQLSKSEWFRTIGETYARVDNRTGPAELFFDILAEELYPFNMDRRDKAAKKMKEAYTQRREQDLIMRRLSEKPPEPPADPSPINVKTMKQMVRGYKTMRKRHK